MRVSSVSDNCLNQFIQLYTPFYGYIALFTNFYFLSEFLSPPGDGRSRSLDNVYLFFKKVIPTEIPPSKSKIHRKNFLKIL